MLTHKERIHAVLNGEPVDRVPVATWGHDFLREWSAQELAAHTVERHKKYQYDFIKLNPRWTLFAEPWGNVYEPPTEQKFPRLVHKIVREIDDLANVPQVSPSHPILREHVRALELVVEQVGAEVDIIATVFSPLSVLGLLAGGVGEPLKGFAHQSPATVHDALQHITATLSGHVEELVAAGASGVFYAALQWTSTDVCDDEFYFEFGRTYDQRVLAAAQNSPFNMFHVCGNNIALDRFLDYPVQVINWDNFGPGNDSLAEAARKTDKVVAGGIPHRKIHRMSAEELQTVARDVLKDAGTNVMLTGGCGIGATVADEIRQSVTEIAEKVAE